MTGALAKTATSMVKKSVNFGCDVSPEGQKGVLYFLYPLFWTGLKKLVCGANKANVERLTDFKERPIPSNWDELLEQAGIEVKRGLGRTQA